MKALVFFTIASFLTASRTFAQGDLNPPPGPPAPTMKSLDQLEPRTIVNAVNTPGDATAQYIISQPGSYYLTGNVIGESGKHGIRVTATDVTLDLSGFALVSAVDSRRGIVVELVGDFPHFALRRGLLRGWPEGGLSAAVTACALEAVRAAGNGGHGLEVGADSQALGCTATGNALTGFVIGSGSQVERCLATSNMAGGFTVGDAGALVGCVARNNGVTAGPDGSGIAAGNGCQILDCTATANFKDGIAVGSGGMVRGCTVRSNGVNGISAVNDISVLDNHSEGNGGPDAFDDPAQILLNGSGNRVEGNTSLNTAANQRSVRADNGGNTIVRNRFRGPGSNLIVANGNTVAPLTTAATIDGASNPFANLFY